MFAALSRDKKLGSKTKHYLCGENEDSVFKVVGRPWVCEDGGGAFLVELGGIFGCESFCQWIFFS